MGRFIFSIDLKKIFFAVFHRPGGEILPDRLLCINTVKQLVSRTMYYQIIVSGDGIFFEQDEKVEPVIGFLANRIVQASSEELAIATSKRDILVQWNQLFNTDRKLGMPRLRIEKITPVKQWLKPRSKQDYFWFTSETHKSHFMDELTRTPPRWFRRTVSVAT